MANPKFSLHANPTFKAVVAIPVPGGKAADVEFVFKGRTRDAFRAFIEDLGARDDVAVLLDISCGWDLEDAFDEASMTLLTQSYLGAARAIIEKYLFELTAARQGN